MTTEEKIESQIIAEFLGYKPDEIPTVLKRLDFRNRWDHLIPVYNKILEVLYTNIYLNELLKKEENIVYAFGIKSVFGIFEHQLHISSAYIKITDFIKWYNRNKWLSSDVQNSGSKIKKVA